MLMVKLDDGAFLPLRAHSWDAGMDIRSPVEVTVPARGSAVIDTGVHITIPSGFAGLLKSKSGLNVRMGIQSEGLIDAGYTGSMVVKLYNHSDTAYSVLRGDKISQLVIIPCLLENAVEVAELPETERGAKGFGSTGR